MAKKTCLNCKHYAGKIRHPVYKELKQAVCKNPTLIRDQKEAGDWSEEEAMARMSFIHFPDEEACMYHSKT